jgi:ADP-ribose pyrophosphatase YjhB (NUDIX family)
MAIKLPKIDQDFLYDGHKIYLRHLSVDCVIFGFHENQLKVLLLKWRNGPWCLPGGFVKKNESLQQSAVRTLYERTNLKDIFLQQFHAFGHPSREKKKSLNKEFRGSWLQDRFVTIGYYALVEHSKVKPHPDQFSDDCKWCYLDSVPELLYDHNEILSQATDALRLDLYTHPIGYNLLPKKFTMPDLQSLYETILGKSIDRRNFQKKILSLNVLTRLKERKTGGAHKSPYFYKFDLAKYKRALAMGWSSGF